jgi:hypothetical protein
MSTTTTDPWEARAAASASYNGYRFYTFRIWYGMVASAWLSLLVRNRFVVSPARLPFTMLGFVTSVLNSILNLVQTLIFARRIRSCLLEEPPIFIIGHWRRTTFLHELLMLDERFTAPTTLECFAPADCTVLDQLMRHLFNFALPAQSSDGQHAGRLGSPAFSQPSPSPPSVSGYEQPHSPHAKML